MFDFNKKSRSVFQSGHSILYPHQQSKEAQENDLWTTTSTKVEFKMLAMSVFVSYA